MNPKTGVKYKLCQSCKKCVSKTNNARAADIRDSLLCKGFRGTTTLTNTEKNISDGLYCTNCRYKFNCGDGFDANSPALLERRSAIIHSMELISEGGCINCSATPWAGAKVKPDRWSGCEQSESRC